MGSNLLCLPLHRHSLSIPDLYTSVQDLFFNIDALNKARTLGGRTKDKIYHNRLNKAIFPQTIVLNIKDRDEYKT